MNDFFAVKLKKLLGKFFLCLMLPFVNPLQGQTPGTLWTKTIGGSNIDVGFSSVETSDSCYVICGYTRSFGTMSGRNSWMIKVDSFGNLLWNQTYGGSNDEEAYSVKETTDLGFIFCGYTKSFGMGGMDVMLTKTDSIGNVVWIKTFGGSLDDEGYSVLQTNDGGFLIAGATSSFGAGSRDIWLIKTDQSGNQMWNKTVGGLSSDGARCVNKTLDGGYILTGWTYSYGPGLIGNAWLVKIDSLGILQWHQWFGGADVDRGYSVKQTLDGGYIFTGYTDSFGSGLYDVYLVKTDSNGAQQWMKTFGGTGRDYGNWIDQTADSGFIITGYTLSYGAGGDDVWLIKTDVNGNLDWSTTYGGAQSDVGNCVIITSDGGYLISGHTLSFGAGVHDLWLIKTGAVIPVELIGFNGEVSGSDVYLSFSTASETNNLGFEIERSTSLSGSSHKWSNIGFISGKGTTTEVQQYSFNDEHLSNGIYNYRLKQIDFDGSLTYSDIIEVEIGNPSEFLLSQNYPNPFNPNTKIKYTIPTVGTRHALSVQLKVYDVLGREVATLVDEYKEAGNYAVDFNPESSIKNQASGVYFYQLKAGDYIDTKKMILLR